MRFVPVLLISFLAMLPPAFAEDEIVCRTTDDDGISFFIAKMEQTSCTFVETLNKDVPCATCPNFAALKAAASKGSQQSCFDWLEKKAACKISPWKDLKTIAQRYEKFMSLAVGVESRFPREALACISVRETMVLDPVSTSCVGDRKKSGYAGLGHMDFEAFSEAIPDKSPEGIRKTDWLKPYNCQKPALSLRAIFEEKYTRDPALQIAAMAKVLESKGKTFSAALRSYNASPKYQAAVKACTTCLQAGGDPLRCLDKSAQGKFSPGGKVCD